MSSEPEEPDLEKQENNKEKPSSILTSLNLNTLKDVIETIAKVGAILVALCYVLGLLIINSYLRRYGIFSAGFLQVDYIMAGALWAFLVAVSYFLLLTVVNFFQVILAMWKQTWRMRILAILLTLFSVIAPAASGAFILMILSDYSLSFGLATWAILGILLVTILTLGTLYDNFRQSLQMFKIGRANKIINNTAKKASIYNVFLEFVFFLLALSMYSFYVYPKLAPAYGGGKKQHAILLAKDVQNANLARLGLKIREDGRSIGPLEIIYEGPDFFVVVPAEGFDPKENIKAIRISKDIFDAIFYVEN